MIVMMMMMIMTIEDGTDSLSRNVGKESPLPAV